MSFDIHSLANSALRSSNDRLANTTNTFAGVDADVAAHFNNLVNAPSTIAKTNAENTASILAPQQNLSDAQKKNIDALPALLKVVNASSADTRQSVEFVQSMFNEEKGAIDTPTMLKLQKVLANMSLSIGIESKIVGSSVNAINTLVKMQ